MTIDCKEIPREEHLVLIQRTFSIEKNIQTLLNFLEFLLLLVCKAKSYFFHFSVYKFFKIIFLKYFFIIEGFVEVVDCLRWFGF